MHATVMPCVVGKILNTVFSSFKSTHKFSWAFWSFAKACRAINVKASTKFSETNISGQKTLYHSTISCYWWIAAILVILISYGKIYSTKCNIQNVRCYIQCSLESVLASDHPHKQINDLHRKRFPGTMEFASLICHTRRKVHLISMSTGHWNPLSQLQWIF